MARKQGFRLLYGQFRIYASRAICQYPAREASVCLITIRTLSLSTKGVGIMKSVAKNASLKRLLLAVCIALIGALAAGEACAQSATVNNTTAETLARKL